MPEDIEGIEIDATSVEGEAGEGEGGAYAEPVIDCEFLTGQAGTGKTYTLMQRIKYDPSWGILCSTTGISAVNLGTVTIHSLLGYYDTDSLRDSYLNGRLERKIFELRKEYRRIAMDEVSMCDGDAFSILVRAILKANEWRCDAPPIGFIVTGDFCQLPPVKARWAFESDEWWRFAEHTTRLTKVWRQGIGPFLDALNLARAGDGAGSSDILTREGLEWHSSLDIHFDGTTIVSKNDAVSRYNAEALSRLQGTPFTLQSRRWGKQRQEWKQKFSKDSSKPGEWGIPPYASFKEGAYVMLLANKYDEGRLVYANGDCGWIVGYDGFGSITVKLVRNGEEVTVERLIRDVPIKERPTSWKESPRGSGDWLPEPHWQSERQKWIEGQIQYFPLRCAYASTVHRSQGLSLDRVQIDIRDRFFAQPGMAYVALSRCRTLEGLRVVGQRERFISHCNVDPKVRGWL